MRRILLVEDSEQSQKIVLRALTHHQVECAENADRAAELMQAQDYDLVLLDINLPGRNGYSLLADLQANPKLKNIPVICLTGKTEVTDKITAFSLGADDYVVKPFDPLELKARVDGRLAKSQRQEDWSQVISIGQLEIDQARHRVAIRLDNGQKSEVPVTQTEFKLLLCLAKKPDWVYTRDQLLVSAWGEDANVLDRSVDVHICSLRKKMKGIGHCLQAVPGVGYRFSPNRAPQSKKAA